MRSLAVALARGGGARTPQLPTPGAALAARLLQLIRLIDGAAADVSAEEAPLDELPPEQHSAPTTALGDLRAVAREPTPGLWRLLLPFGVFGEVGDLRLYLRDDPSREGSGRRQRRADDEPPRRAISSSTSTASAAASWTRCARAGASTSCCARRTRSRLICAGVEAVFTAACEAGGLVGEFGFRPYELLQLPRPDRPRDHSLTV